MFEPRFLKSTQVCRLTVVEGREQGMIPPAEAGLSFSPLSASLTWPRVNHFTLWALTFPLLTRSWRHLPWPTHSLYEVQRKESVWSHVVEHKVQHWRESQSVNSFDCGRGHRRGTEPSGDITPASVPAKNLLPLSLSCCVHLLRHTWLPECQFQDQSLTSEILDYRIVSSNSRAAFWHLWNSGPRLDGLRWSRMALLKAAASK